MSDFYFMEDPENFLLPDLPSDLPSDQATSPASSTRESNNDDVHLYSELTNTTLPSSPPPARGRERRNPSITPRKFNRFFTPRSLRDSTSRQTLFNITATANNDNFVQSSPIRQPNEIPDLPLLDNGLEPFPRDLKRRKVLHLTEETLKGCKGTTVVEVVAVSEDHAESERSAEGLSPFKRASRRCVDKEIIAQAASIPKPEVALEECGLSGRLLQMSLGSCSTSRRKFTSHAVGDWQNETAHFYSKPVDTHICNSHDSGQAALPFCTVACNRSTLVAVGDESGRVKILESEADGQPGFHKSYVSFNVHTNAIFDMSFSQDDTLLATASADQTAKIIDMVTQQTISTLAQHTASVKQVRFQPGASNNSVIATSSRDGSVEIWDLRCTGNGGPVNEIYQPNDPILNRIGQPGYGYAINSIYEAHKPYIPPTLGKKPRLTERAGVPSVTSLAFMPQGLEHLLLTASEDNASVRIWDIRALYKTHKEWAIPLSSTEQPQSHNNFRHFGIVSMNLGGDASRLYTLCKDNTVYVYSTAHLILGHAPELSTTTKFRRPAETQRNGLSALYGFRHPSFLTSSFYVKSSLRKERNGKCEMLAVGSSRDGCAILFPTDERYLSFAKSDGEPKEKLGPILRKRPINNSQKSSRAIENDIPICQNGTALIGGHEKEVSSLAWTSEGELITMSDDYLVRCWRENPEEARELRVNGEQGGQRWSCGWAEVGAGFDEDDG